VFATILAMITDEINNVMLAARSGKAPVALSGHILLLNWNQQVWLHTDTASFACWAIAHGKVFVLPWVNVCPLV
jgi:hypothetical protein